MAVWGGAGRVRSMSEELQVAGTSGRASGVSILQQRYLKHNTA